MVLRAHSPNNWIAQLISPHFSTLSPYFTLILLCPAGLSFPNVRKEMIQGGLMSASWGFSLRWAALAFKSTATSFSLCANYTRKSQEIKRFIMICDFKSYSPFSLAARLPMAAAFL